MTFSMLHFCPPCGLWEARSQFLNPDAAAPVGRWRGSLAKRSPTPCDGVTDPNEAVTDPMRWGNTPHRRSRRMGARQSLTG